MKVKYNKFIEIEKMRVGCLNERDMFLSDLAILEDKTLDSIKDLTFSEINELIIKYDGFYKKLSEKKISQFITIDGIKMKMDNVEDIAFGRFIDLEEILKNKNLEDYKKVPMVIAILLNKEKEDVLYKKKFEEYVEKIGECDFDEVLACSGFFLHRERRKLTNSPIYLRERITVIKTLLTVAMEDLLSRMIATRQNLVGFTGGIRSLSIYLMMTLLKWVKSKI